MELKNRLSELLGYLDISRSELARKIDVKSYKLNDIARGQTKRIPSDVLNGICREFPNISEDWLLTGQGEMLNRPRVEPNAEVFSHKNVIDVMEVPVIPLSARAGYLGDYEQISADEQYETMLIPNEKVRYGKYLIFTVSGESMTPMLEHRDRVLAHLVDPSYYKDSRLNINKWSVWVIVTRTEGILIKHISNHDVENHTITLHSYNSMYADFEVDLADVVDIYNAVEIVSRRL